MIACQLFFVILEMKMSLCVQIMEDVTPQELVVFATTSITIGQSTIAVSITLDLKSIQEKNVFLIKEIFIVIMWEFVIKMEVLAFVINLLIEFLKTIVRHSILHDLPTKLHLIPLYNQQVHLQQSLQQINLQIYQA